MNNRISKKTATTILLIISFAFIICGIMRNEYIDVLNKAKFICFECIGIG